jgi:orotate phosphoribosyltransferase
LETAQATYTNTGQTELAELLLESGALVFGDFKLPDNRRTPVILNTNQMLATPDTRRTFALIGFLSMGGDTNGIIAGVPESGNDLAMNVSIEYQRKFLRLPKDLHGPRNALRSYDYFENHDLTLFEDIVATGKTVKKYTKYLLNLGFKVKRVITYLDREMGGAELLADLGVSLEPIITVSEALDYYSTKGLLPEEKLKQIRATLEREKRPKCKVASN